MKVKILAAAIIAISTFAYYAQQSVEAGIVWCRGCVWPPTG